MKTCRVSLGCDPCVKGICALAAASSSSCRAPGRWRVANCHRQGTVMRPSSSSKASQHPSVRTHKRIVPWSREVANPRQVEWRDHGGPGLPCTKGGSRRDQANQPQDLLKMHRAGGMQQCCPSPTLPCQFTNTGTGSPLESSWRRMGVDEGQRTLEVTAHLEPCGAS